MIDETIKKCKRNKKEYTVGFWKMQKINITELCYADVMAIIGDTERNLQHNMNLMNS